MADNIIKHYGADTDFCYECDHGGHEAVVCPTCGPFRVEKHLTPHIGIVIRCVNCKEHLGWEGPITEAWKSYVGEESADV